MASQKLEELYVNSKTCTMCYKEVQHMNQRSCGHVICEKCNSDFTTPTSGRRCKLCIIRHDSTCSADGPSYLVSVKPSIPAKRRQSDPSSRGLFCVSCRQTSSTLAYCKDCNGDICRTCYDQHANLSALRTHRLNLQTPLPDSPTSPPIYCHQHPNNYANSVCDSCHGIRVCRACVREAHKGHITRDSSSTPLDTPTVMLSPGLSSMPQDTFGDMVKQLENLQLNVQERTTTLSSSIKEAEKEIQMTARSRVQKITEEAEKMKRDIDHQVSEDTANISRQRENLLRQLGRRRAFIQQRTQVIKSELTSAHRDARRVLSAFNRLSLDPEGYTQMVQCQDIFTKRQQLKEKIASLQKSFNELTFEYEVSTGEGSYLGRITTMRKWSRILDSHVQRIQQDTEYVPSAMVSAPNDTVLFTSYKESTKAALDLVNINGNAIHTRKLQDNGVNTEPVPAFGAMVDNDVALMGWETAVFILKLSTLDPVTSVGIKNSFVPSARIRCLVSDENLNRVAIGNDKNRIINLFDFNLKPTSSVTIKEEGPPPCSLASQGNCILFTDGKKTALAVDLNGNTIAQFLPPGALNLKPVAVDTSRELVYVLWVNDSSAVVQCYTMQSPAVLGEPIGEPLNELPGNTTFIAVKTTADGDDRLVAGTSDARIVVYCVQEM